MNQTQAKQIQFIISELEGLADKVVEVKDALQEKMDNASESYPESDAGQKLQEEIDALENAGDEFDSLINSLTDGLPA